MRSYVLWIAALASSGCYVYAPVGESTPEPGHEVRIRLSPAQEVPVGEVTVRDATTIEGVAWGESDDGLSLRTTWVRTNLGARFYAENSVLTFPRTEISQVEERRIHVARTVVALAVGVGFGAGVFSFLADPGGEPTGDTGGGDIGLRVTGFWQ